MPIKRRLKQRGVQHHPVILLSCPKDFLPKVPSDEILETIFCKLFSLKLEDVKF